MNVSALMILCWITGHCGHCCDQSGRVETCQVERLILSSPGRGPTREATVCPRTRCDPSSWSTWGSSGLPAPPRIRRRRGRDSRPGWEISLSENPSTQCRCPHPADRLAGDSRATVAPRDWVCLPVYPGQRSDCWPEAAHQAGRPALLSTEAGVRLGGRGQGQADPALAPDSLNGPSHCPPPSAQSLLRQHQSSRDLLQHQGVSLTHQKNITKNFGKILSNISH